MDYKFLKSGSDIRGTAVDSLGSPVTLDDRAVCTIVDAFVFWISRLRISKSFKVAVGYDSRVSSKKIHSWVIKSLKFAGCDIVDCALASTPAMFMMTVMQGLECDAAIMITASHLPKDKNGLKFFTSNGGLSSKDIDKILSYAASGKYFKSKDYKGSYANDDYMGKYCDYLVGRVRTICKDEYPFDGLRIVVDASNGSGGFFAQRILKKLGADITGSQFLEPDGEFPNHIPNPEDIAAMASLRRAVLDNKADIGIIFDTDVDRAAVVDSSGDEINKSSLIALISAVLLAETPKGYIITDSVTCRALTEFIKSLGGRHHRYRRGYNNVISEAKRFVRSNMNALLAIETSGHAAFRENFFLDDGAYLALRIISQLSILKKQGMQLSDLVKGFDKPIEEREFRIKILTGDFAQTGRYILDGITQFAMREFDIDSVSYEGVRVNVDAAQGCFVARLSLHDPVIPVYIESDVEGGVYQIANMLYQRLSLIDSIDASALISNDNLLVAPIVGSV